MVAAIVAFVVGVVTPCAIAFWIDAAYLSLVEEILIWTARLTGCLPNPWLASARRLRR